VLIFNSTTRYVYHKTLPDGKIEHSEGNFIWLIILANDLETIVFGNKDYRPGGPQYHFRIQELKKYIAENKGGNKTIDRNDLIALTSKKPTAKASEVEKKEIPVINIDGVKWVIDKEKNIMFKKNNPNQISNIDDMFDKLSEKAQEQLLNLMEGRLNFLRKKTK
jgi:hypothetical protein